MRGFLFVQYLCVMKLLLFYLLFLIPALLSCKNNNESEKEDFFPVLSYLQSQVAQVDTSLYRIIKITKTDSTSDTTFVPRGEFRKLAADFTSIPDINNEDLRDDYTETKLYDDVLKRVLFSYTPKENDLPIQRQEVTVAPSTDGGEVKTIYIGQVLEADDSTVEKKMLWQVNQGFRIVTTISKENKEPSTRITEVLWNTTPPAE